MFNFSSKLFRGRSIGIKPFYNMQIDFRRTGKISASILRLQGIKSTLISTIVILVMVFYACCSHFKSSALKVTSGNYWKEQAIRDILPYWIAYARDSVYGAFITNLDDQWNPLPDYRKYPGMIGRHIFSYAVAYLITGDDKYLSIAASTKDFLLQYAWDKQYGGWYDILNRDGSPASMTKSMFNQTYALTGLVMYYFVTHDQEVLSYIKKANTLICDRLWDKISGGYYNVATEDWSVLDSNKSFASQVAPVSGYLLYLYLATHDRQFLVQSERIMEAVAANMTHPESGWILEDFDSNWNYIPRNPDLVNSGHNLEVAWMFLRLAMLEKGNEYGSISHSMEERGIFNAFDRKSGIWYALLEKDDLTRHENFTYWWIQAYGNMYNLISYRFFGDESRIADFQMGADFWDRYFIDRKHGDTYMSVENSGKIRESNKANPYKTSYHSMEHCLINLLYLNLWINFKPVDLHFRFASPREGDTLFPFPIEDPNLEIIKAYRKDDPEKQEVQSAGRFVLIPPSDTVRMVITIKGKESLSLKVSGMHPRSDKHSHIDNPNKR